MTSELLLGLAAFAFVSSITPGPNNLMLMASGANFGFVRTIPHMLGVGIGFVVMVVIVGLGLVGLYTASPLAQSVFRALSVAYMCYLAWRIARAAPASAAAGGAGARPLGFLGAAAFQWVNPKAWAMALTAVSVYAPGGTAASVILVALVFGAINLPSVSLWTVMGQGLRRWLAQGVRLRVFNVAMAALLLASLYPVLWPAA